MTEEDQLLYALGYCAFILLLFLLFSKFPPKKINWFYGYRTRRSMANESIWKEANNYSLKLSVIISLYSFALPVICYFIYPSNNFLITVIVHTLLILSIYFFTEKHLDQTFDKNGKPK